MQAFFFAIARFLLFRFPAERSHELGLDGLKWLHRLGLMWLIKPHVPTVPVAAWGLRFPNPVGLAAGLDKNADYVDALGSLGFGFIEVGTVTPLPQEGNPQPRLFRLSDDLAIINRMGFNNKGVDHLVEQLKKRKWRGIVGVNIGKNLTTPVENAVDDYLVCLRKVYPVADYVVVNLSSPNTPGLRNLQFGEQLDALLAALKAAQAQLQTEHKKRVPLLVKIAPDLTEDEVNAMAAAFLKHRIDGVIATNTTLDRPGVEDSLHGNEAGGLSGLPLRRRSTRVIKWLTQALGPDVPVIGAGGVMWTADANEKFRAGARLVQIYTGFIYEGPALIRTIANAALQNPGGVAKNG
ncbi:MAG: quinone-dependent dihydroorotate dehydrogenase [Gammaproteobacteria bacterium]